MYAFLDTTILKCELHNFDSVSIKINSHSEALELQ